MTLILIAVACWAAALLLLAGILQLTEPDEEEDQELAWEPVWEPEPDDEVEKPDAWGRTPDWNWPRGYGGSPRE